MAIRNVNDPLGIYVWNNGRANFFVDDLEIEVFEPKFDPSFF